MKMKTASALFCSAATAVALYGTDVRADLSVTEHTVLGVDNWSIKEPVVTQADTSYSQVAFKPGETFKITDVGGCVQTGGSGRTWKRYVNPSGDNSDHLYHGTIRLPGMDGSMRIGDFRNANPQGFVIPANAGGDMSLHLGYEDDGYGDNGYWGHDDGTEDQCKHSVNAFIDFSITQPPRPTVSLQVEPQTVVAGSARELRVILNDHVMSETIQHESAAVAPAAVAKEQSPLHSLPQHIAESTQHVTESMPRPAPHPFPHPPVFGPYRVVLKWTSSDATSCAWTNVLSGQAALNGTQGFDGTNGTLVAGLYDFKITCTGGGGSASDHKLLTVTPAPPTVSFSVTPSSIVKGSAAVLNWTTSNADTCHADGELGWNGAEPLSGSQSVSPAVLGAHVYKLTCQGGGLTSTTQTATLTVTAPPLPVVSISVAPSSASLGDSATLTWSATNATACTASGSELHWSGAQPVSGSLSVKPLTKGAHTYKLSCSGDGGSADNQATLTIN